jgi:hypothetical protein
MMRYTTENLETRTCVRCGKSFESPKVFNAKACDECIEGKKPRALVEDTADWRYDNVKCYNRLNRIIGEMTKKLNRMAPNEKHKKMLEDIITADVRSRYFADTAYELLGKLKEELEDAERKT